MYVFYLSLYYHGAAPLENRTPESSIDVMVVTFYMFFTLVSLSNPRPTDDDQALLGQRQMDRWETILNASTPTKTAIDS